jgi:glutathione S-transferase
MIMLFDLITSLNLRPSAYCWRAKLALIHKNRQFESQDMKYSEIPSIGGGSFKTLPVIRDEETWVSGSSNIAEHLEARYPKDPTLFPRDPHREFVGFIEAWVDSSIYAQMFPIIACDIWNRMFDSERDYFRKTREARLGMTLEAARELHQPRIPDLRRALEPLRTTLKSRNFLCGESPAYADYIVFGAMKWTRLFSEALEFDDRDPIEAWFLAINKLAIAASAS